jgi:uncharacterized protein YjbJ (UPF0337 family)
MDWERIRTDWTQLKGKVKEDWGRLTDDDLLEISRQREQLLAKIRKRYHLAVDEAERRVREWERRIDVDVPPSE